MLSVLIESFFRDTSASSITELFLVVIVVVFIAASVLGALSRSKRFTDYAATLLTSIGILGTFAGIVTPRFYRKSDKLRAVGLSPLDFDAEIDI